MLEDVGSQIARLVEQARQGEEVITLRDSTPVAKIVSLPAEKSAEVASHKLSVAKPVDVFFANQIRLLSLQLLPVTLAHVARASTLPFHHRDPFNRMLVAQSLVESIPIVSADPALDAYGVTRLWQPDFKIT